MIQSSPKPNLDKYVQRVEFALDRLLPGPDEEPASLHQAMRYACLNGGKRIRAMLTYAAGRTLGSDLDDLDVPASAVEMVHAYSLVHDDLPAMDDDDLRRGKPTCHIVYGESTAILAGDALLTRAFEILTDAESSVPAERRARMVAVLASALGSKGMVGGQVLDLAGENQSLGLEELKKIHKAKTGALITAAIQLGGLGSPRSDASTLAAFERFGQEIGMAFQIIDDVLDETGNAHTLGKHAGSDQAAGKSTYPAAVGLVDSRRLAAEHYRLALGALDEIKADTSMLRDIAAMVIERSS